jgi:hypothetical protein
MKLRPTPMFQLSFHHRQAGPLFHARFLKRVKINDVFGKGAGYYSFPPSWRKRVRGPSGFWWFEYCGPVMDVEHIHKYNLQQYKAMLRNKSREEWLLNFVEVFMMTEDYGIYVIKDGKEGECNDGFCTGGEICDFYQITPDDFS